MQSSNAGAHPEKVRGDLNDLVDDGEKLLKSSAQGPTAQARQARLTSADALEKANGANCVP